MDIGDMIYGSIPKVNTLAEAMAQQNAPGDYLKGRQNANELDAAIRSGDMGAIMKLPGGADYAKKVYAAQSEAANVPLRRAQTEKASADALHATQKTNSALMEESAQEAMALSQDPNLTSGAVGAYVRREMESGRDKSGVLQKSLEEGGIDPNNIEQLRQWAKNVSLKGMSIANQLKQRELDNPKGVVVQQGDKATLRNPYDNTQIGETLPIAASPDAVIRAATTERGQNIRRVGITHGVKGLTEAQNEALFGVNGAVTTGKLDPNRINSKTASIFADAFIKNPNTDMAKLSADISLSRNATFRQRALTAETLPEIMREMVDAGKKLDFSKLKPVGDMQEWVKKQSNDPDFREYMAIRNDAMMTIANVMRGIGMSDKSIQMELESAPKSMSPDALEAWMRGQMKSLEPRLKINKRIIKDGASPQPGKPNIDDMLKDLGVIK